MNLDVLFQKDKTTVVIFPISFDLHWSIVFKLIVSRRPYPLVTVICAWFGMVIECMDDHYHTLRGKGNWFWVRESASDVVSRCGTTWASHGRSENSQKSMYRPPSKRSWCVTQSAFSYDCSVPVINYEFHGFKCCLSLQNHVVCYTARIGHSVGTPNDQMSFLLTRINLNPNMDK